MNRFIRNQAESERVFFSRYGPIGPWRCHFCPEPITYKASDSYRNSNLFPWGGQLSIEHLDGNCSNNELMNLRPAHQSCNAKSFWENLSPDEKNAKMRHMMAGVTSEDLSRAGRKGGPLGAAALTVEQRAANGVKIAAAWAAKTDIEKAAIVEKRQLAQTKEERIVAAKKGWSRYSPEAKTARMAKSNSDRKNQSESARKGWETRRRNLEARKHS